MPDRPHKFYEIVLSREVSLNAFVVLQVSLARLHSLCSMQRERSKRNTRGGVSPTTPAAEVPCKTAPFASFSGRAEKEGPARPERGSIFSSLVKAIRESKHFHEKIFFFIEKGPVPLKQTPGSVYSSNIFLSVFAVLPTVRAMISSPSIRVVLPRGIVIKESRIR